MGGGVPNRSIVRGGLIGSVAAIYIALVGLYTKFAELELVGEQVTLGRILLMAPGARRGLRRHAAATDRRGASTRGVGRGRWWPGRSPGP